MPWGALGTARSHPDSCGRFERARGAGGLVGVGSKYKRSSRCLVDVSRLSPNNRDRRTPAATTVRLSS